MRGAAMSGGPRNRPAYDRAQRLTAEIIRIWGDLEARRAPFARPISAKDIAQRLALNISLSAIRRHMRAIRHSVEGAPPSQNSRTPRAFIGSPMALENSAMTTPICSADEEPGNGRPPR